jgi:hypothetical protein
MISFTQDIFPIMLNFMIKLKLTLLLLSVKISYRNEYNR